MRPGIYAGFAGAAMTAALAACGAGGTSPGAPHAVVSPGGHRIGTLNTPGTPKGEQTIPIEVIATTRKPHREALALVPIYIDGIGPLPFALDTGASKSMIAARLASRLGLPVRGRGGVLRGIAGSGHAELVQIRSWRAGKVTLPPSVVAALTPTAAARSGPRALNPRTGPVGLLGSDVLSRYGKIAIDYNKALLILDPRVS